MKAKLLAILTLAVIFFSKNAASAKHSADDDYAHSYFDAAVRYATDVYAANPTVDSFSAAVYARYGSYFSTIGDLYDDSNYRLYSYIYAAYAVAHALREYSGLSDLTSVRSQELYAAFYSASMAVYFSHSSLLHP